MKITTIQEQYKKAGLTKYEITQEERDLLVIQKWFALRSAGYHVPLDNLLKTIW